MTEAQVKPQIEARCQQILTAVNNRDFPTFAKYHTENCTLMYQDEPTYRGRPAVIERTQMLISDMRITKTVLEEVNYIKLLNDYTAYTNVFIKGMDQTGKVVAKFRFTYLWQKIGQDWLIDRKFVNYREPTPRDHARKEIEAQMTVLYKALSQKDIEGALKVYSDEPTMLIPGHENVVGKKDGSAALMKLLPSMKTLVLDRIFYFGMFRDDVVQTIAYVNLIDEHGKVFNRIRDCFLWKKMHGNWLIKRYTYNEVPRM